MGYAKNSKSANSQSSNSHSSNSQSSKKKGASSDTTISTSSPTSTPETSPTSTPETTSTSPSETASTSTSETTPTPTPENTPTPTPENTPASIQQQQVLSSPQVDSLPTTALLINPPTTTPMSIPTLGKGLPNNKSYQDIRRSSSPNGTMKNLEVPKVRSSLLTPPHQQKTRDNGISAFILSLALGLVAPLLIMSAGGIFWLLVKWQMKRQQLVREEKTQVNSWVNSSQSVFDSHEIGMLASEPKSTIANNISKNDAEPSGSARKQSSDNAAHRKESHNHANQTRSNIQASLHARQSASRAALLYCFELSQSLFEKVDPAVPDGGQEEKHKLMKPQSILKTQPNAGKSKRVTVVDSKTSTFQTAP